MSLLPLRPDSTSSCIWPQAIEYSLQGLRLPGTLQDVLPFALIASRHFNVQGLLPTTDVRGVVADVETMHRGS